MRIFVLGTGRCGTTTFARACAHLTNFTAGHETRAKRIGADRFAYPDRHIEADNRLCWFLGELGHRFPDAWYVHLRRDREEVVDSFLRRWNTKSIIRAFGHQVVLHGADWPDDERRDVCGFYVDTVTANVAEFLAQRRSMTIWLSEAPVVFPAFLDWIDAEGDLAAAMAEWGIRHNATPMSEPAVGRQGRQQPSPAPA
jgi:hypothetical protein